MNLSSIHLVLLLLVSATPTLCCAQQRVEVPREDGHTTPLMVYTAVPAPASGCAPLALISHGAGGSENGYRYLAQAMSNLGYTAVVMGHRESGLPVMRSSIAARGMHPGVQAVVADPAPETARLLDVTAALAWSDKTCKPLFRVLLGHSMGAVTVMLEAGARNNIGVAATVAGKSRFDAYVALSPEGPGLVFPEHAWTDIKKPMLVLTGTLDGALNGGPLTRQAAWHELPGLATHCQWLGVVDGANHANFAGNQEGHERVEPYVTSTIASFLKGVRAGACTLPPPVAGMTLQAK